MASPSYDISSVAQPDSRLPLPLERTEMATRAMLRFACARSECPDTCCRDFGIHLDQPSMNRMLSTTAHNPIDHERIVRLVVLGMPLPNAGKTQVALGEDGACPLLESSGHCELHKKYGESSLSTVCSVFPRTSLALQDRLEVTGTLACPELARLTLLSEDGLSQEPSTKSILPRSYIGKVVDTENEISDAYAAPFLQVRSTLLDLFGRQDFPLSSRLVFAAHLAAQVDNFFHRHTDAFEGSKHQFARHRLAKELSAATSSFLLEELHGELQAFTGTSDAVITAALSLLTERLRLPHPSRYSDLVTSFLRSLGKEFTVSNCDGSTTASPEALRNLEQQRKRMEIRLPGITDQILSRYCQHYLLRHPYTDATSLLNYLGRLSLSLAAIKLLILGSPKLHDQIDAHAFSEMAVDVIQVFTKAVSHQADFLAAIQRASETGSGVSFGRLVLFAKFQG